MRFLESLASILDPEVAPMAKRRNFSAACKRRVLDAQGLLGRHANWMFCVPTARAAAAGRCHLHWARWKENLGELLRHAAWPVD